MLAVRLALTDTPGVLVFDEVDAGVGGVAATAVGAALARLGSHAQVLVVTHLAQVAAHADHQLVVGKVEEGRPHPLGGHRPRRRGPGGGTEPDALGPPGERRRGATPGSCSTDRPPAEAPSRPGTPRARPHVEPSRR